MARHRRPRPGAAHASAKSDDVTLKIEVFRERRTEAGCERVPVPGVKVHVYDECGENEIKPTDYRHPSQGPIEIALPPGTVVRLIPRFDAAERTPALYTPLASGFLVSVDSERNCPIPIQYYTSPAEVWASACVHDEQAAAAHSAHAAHTGLAAMPAGHVLLPNVTFRLYQGVGIASNVVDSFTTTGDSLEAVFEELAPGYYTLRADMPNQGSYKPCCTTQVFHVCEGQCLDLTCCFCFKSVTNDVTACVRDDCGNSLPGVTLQLVGNQGHHVGTTIDNGMVTFSAVKVGAYTLTLPGGKHIASDGSKWEAPTPPSVQVRSAATPVSVALTLQRDILTIDIEVVDPQGKSQPNAVVQIFDATRTNVIDTVVLDGDGKHTWIAPADEVYYFALKPAPGGAPARLYIANDQAGS